jgi:hypothetical protein
VSDCVDLVCISIFVSRDSRFLFETSFLLFFAQSRSLNSIFTFLFCHISLEALTVYHSCQLIIMISSRLTLTHAHTHTLFQVSDLLVAARTENEAHSQRLLSATSQLDDLGHACRAYRRQVRPLLAAAICEMQYVLNRNICHTSCVAPFFLHVDRSSFFVVCSTCSVSLLLCLHPSVLLFPCQTGWFLYASLHSSCVFSVFVAVIVVLSLPLFLRFVVRRLRARAIRSRTAPSGTIRRTKTSNWLRCAMRRCISS